MKPSKSVMLSALVQTLTLPANGLTFTSTNPSLIKVVAVCQRATFHVEIAITAKYQSQQLGLPLEDDKFERHECSGLDRLFKGWARLGLSDQEILTKGFECFDALYAALKIR